MKNVKMFSMVAMMIAFTFATAFKPIGDPILDKAEKMPTIKGCENEDADLAMNCTYMKVLNGLVSNLKYPADAKKNGTEGTVFIEFVVNKEGSVQDAKIKKDVKDGCGQAALTAFNASVGASTWNAGEDKGKKVNVRMIVPVKFKLK